MIDQASAWETTMMRTSLFSSRFFAASPALALALALLAIAPIAHAGSSFSMGKSSAQMCYQAATYGAINRDLQMCTRAIEHEEMTRIDLAATYSNRGILWAARGELKHALDDQNQAIKINPVSARAYINRAGVYHLMKKYDAALADYNTALGLSGGDMPVLYFNRSLSFAAVGKNDAAIADIEHALELEPGNATYEGVLNRLKSL